MKIRKLLSSALAMALAITMIPTTGFTTTAKADTVDTSTTDTSTTDTTTGVTTLTRTIDGMQVSKTATLENDGTYTFDLEAYSTGTVKPTTVKADPVDVVLVLDVSGSMDESLGTSTYIKVSSTTQVKSLSSGKYYHKCADGTYNSVTVKGNNFALFSGYKSFTITCSKCNTSYTGLRSSYVQSDWEIYSYGSSYKIDAMKDAANAFIDKVAETNDSLGEEDIKNQVAVVTYASSAKQVAGLTAVTESTKTNIETSINDLSANGATYADEGITKAASILTDSSVVKDGRKKIVIFLTDGEPNHGSDYVPSVAKSVITTAGYLKNGSTVNGVTYPETTIYTIGVSSYADVADTGSGSVTKSYAINKYLHAVSSNYKNAKSTSTSNSECDSTYNDTGITLGDRNSDGVDYYKVAQNASDIYTIFNDLASTTTGAILNVNASAVLKDYMAEGFDLSNATIEAASYDFTGTNKGTYEFSTTASDVTTVTYKDGTPTKSGSAYTISVEDNIVSATGFDYSSKFCMASDTASSEDVYPKADGNNGAKFVVKITGVVATADVSAESEIVNTNNTNNEENTDRVDKSGIYSNSTDTTPIVSFPEPKTEINEEFFVMDYAKEATLTYDTLKGVTHLDATGMNKFDPASPNISMSGTYGNITTTSYEPTTTNWNGFDTYYGFGQWKTIPVDPDDDDVAVTTGANVWTKISVLPANNVYYEDTFEDNSDGTVKISYSGSWTTETSDDAGNNTGDVKKDQEGYVTDLDDDAQDSDGTVHYSTSTGDTVSFTFTGEGVDVYSRTDNKVGAVKAYLYDKNSESANYNKVVSLKTVQNDSQSDTYYQIPTVSFKDLDYGTYKVVLKVIPAKSDSTRLTYYVDGIRVYNPICDSSKATTDKTINDAYTAYEELNSLFVDVHEMLSAVYSASDSLSSNSNRAVFIDYVPAETEESTDDENVTDTNGTDTNTESTDTAASGEVGKVVNDVSTYDVFGPKNEVYLGSNNAIAFAVPATVTDISIGLKAPSGDSTVATVSNGTTNSTIDVSSASDMYYTINPYQVKDEEGNVTAQYVEIKNTGKNLLAVTKIKLTYGETFSGVTDATGSFSGAPSDDFSGVDSETATEEVTTASISDFEEYANLFTTFATTVYDKTAEKIKASDTTENQETVTEEQNTGEVDITTTDNTEAHHFSALFRKLLFSMLSTLLNNL